MAINTSMMPIAGIRKKKKKSAKKKKPALSYDVTAAYDRVYEKFQKFTFTDSKLTAEELAREVAEFDKRYSEHQNWLNKNVPESQHMSANFLYYAYNHPAMKDFAKSLDEENKIQS